MRSEEEEKKEASGEEGEEEAEIEANRVVSETRGWNV